MFGSDCGYLDHRATEIAGQQAQTTVGTERRRMSAQDIVVETSGRRVAPHQPLAIEKGLLRIETQPVTRNGTHILVQQAGLKPFANQQARSEEHTSAPPSLMRI